MRPVTSLAIAAALAVSVGGCHRSTPGGVGLKQVNDAFLAAGLKLDSFQPADAKAFSAQSCHAGTLDGIEALVCEATDDKTAQAGVPAAEAWVAKATTGTVLTNGRTLLALADRSHADPNGKRIHAITRAFRGLK